MRGTRSATRRNVSCGGAGSLSMRTAPVSIWDLALSRWVGEGILDGVPGGRIGFDRASRRDDRVPRWSGGLVKHLAKNLTWRVQLRHGRLEIGCPPTG